MTNTRKAIIEIIEPYMDKALSEGCLIKRGLNTYRYLYRLWDKDFHRFMIVNQLNNTKLARFQKDKLSIEAVFWRYIENKILWHYDITAVLKYIENIVWSSNLKIKWITQKEIIMQDTRKGLYINIIFPNKPLHLYTEQEEKELLDLLTKLK